MRLQSEIFSFRNVREYLLYEQWRPSITIALRKILI
jgi:hypothetical protein